MLFSRGLNCKSSNNNSYFMAHFVAFIWQKWCKKARENMRPKGPFFFCFLQIIFQGPKKGPKMHFLSKIKIFSAKIAGNNSNFSLCMTISYTRDKEILLFMLGKPKAQYWCFLMVLLSHVILKITCKGRLFWDIPYTGRLLSSMTEVKFEGLSWPQKWSFWAVNL